MSATTTSNSCTAYCYGGVFDVDNDEDLASQFFNDCCLLDTVKMQWKVIQPSGGKTKAKPTEEKNGEKNSLIM